jgi:hypothetical protein
LLLDPDGFGALIQDRAHSIVAAGPPPLTDLEREDRRHALTGELDDLTGCTDDDELVHIGAQILTSAAEPALLHQCKWIGHGKWLRLVLNRSGGALQEGYRRRPQNLMGV